MLEALSWLIYPAAFLVALAILIVFHEYGHYCVARWCGVKILRFSIGFGKVLWRKKTGPDQTEWAISALPLGGYVKMLDEREETVAAEEAHRAFNRQSLTRRNLIVAAGPLANMLLAVLIYTLIFWIGNKELRPLLDTPSANSPAAQAGLMRGDEIKRVDDSQVRTWNEFRWLLLKKAATQDSVSLEITTSNNQTRNLHLAIGEIRKSRWEGDALSHLGVSLYLPRIRPILAKALPGGVADKAGLRTNDEISSINGEVVNDWRQVVTIIQESAEKPLKLGVIRQGTTLYFTLVPRAVEHGGSRIGRVDISVQPTRTAGEPSMRRLVSYALPQAALRAIYTTWDQTKFSLLMIGRMFTGEVSLSNISGPVTIADYAGKTAQLGWVVYLKFLAVISIGLGIINLLPIPVLDGGHLMYHTLEYIWRRPLPESFLIFGQRLGLAMLLTLTFFAIFNDIFRIWEGS